MIETEINRKKYDQYEYLRGSHVKITTINIEKQSPFEQAKTLDMNLRSGIYSINELRRQSGLETVEDEWGDVHFMTLNYDIVDKFLTGEQGSGNKNKNAPTNDTESEVKETNGEE